MHPQSITRTRARNTLRMHHFSGRVLTPHPTGSERCSKKTVTNVRLPRSLRESETRSSIFSRYKLLNAEESPPP